MGIVICIYSVFAVNSILLSYKVKKYLSEKYTEEIVVKSTGYSTLWGLYCTAYPVEWPQIAFDVYKDNLSGGFFDNYLNKSLEYDTNTKFQTLLDSIYTIRVNCSSAIYLTYEEGVNDMVGYVDKKIGRPATWDNIHGSKKVDWLWIDFPRAVEDEDYASLIQLFQFANKEQMDIHFVFRFHEDDKTYMVMIDTNQWSNMNTEQGLEDYIKNNGSFLN